MKKTAIYELIIDEEDDESGVELISLVKQPANKFNYRVFDEDEEPHDCSRHFDFSDDALKIFDELGENIPTEVLIQGNPVEMDLTIQEFASPNPTSNPKIEDVGYDNPEGIGVKRYVYVVDTGQGAPLISTSREMCRKMIRAQKVFRRQDIQQLSQRLEALGEESFKYVFRQRGLGVDVFEYKFGKNDRHCWRQLEFYKKPNESFDELLSRIPNNSRRATGQADAVIQGAERPFISEARYLMSDDSNKPIGFHYGLFIYKNKFDCMLGEPDCKNMTRVKVGDMEGWVGVNVIESYFEGTGSVFETFKVKEKFEVPTKEIQEAAQRARKYKEENGTSCGTNIGWIRSSQLAKGENISLDTISRMYSYLSRHKVDLETSTSYEKGCGKLMYDAWGGEAALDWSKRILDRETDMSVKFSSDEYRGDITAVVFEPDTYVYRWDDDEKKPYYVFMSADTIRKMLMKVSRVKQKDFINIEHTKKIFKGDEVYTYENWLVGEDPKKDKSYEIFGREMKPGTWITTIHFRNRELFDEFILSNKTAGISLEGSFMEIPFNFSTIKEQFDFPKGTCWDGYEPYGTKIVNGREVPNCVPIKASQNFNEEIEIYGYTTRYFYICPGAISTFNHLVEMNLDEETQGMVRSAALQADRVFQLEAEVIEKGYATEDEYKEAVVFVDDFKDLIGEIDKITGMVHNVDYMDGHIEVIKKYLTPENENMEDISDDEMITYIQELLKSYKD